MFTTIYDVSDTKAKIKEIIERLAPSAPSRKNYRHRQAVFARGNNRFSKNSKMLIIALLTIP